jgi:putative transposase
MKKRRQFSQEFKKEIVDKFYKGELTAAQLASEHKLHPEQIYKWKYESEGRRPKERIQELQDEGRSATDIRYIMQLEEELSEYKKKVGELALENELLKKLKSGLPTTRSASGFTKIKQELDQLKRRAK